MKKLILPILLLLFALPVYAGDFATVIHKITGYRKVVTVGDPNAFVGGFTLETNSKMLGAKPFRPSGYETTLANSLAEEGTETTLTVNSLTLPDDTTLDDDNYGDLLILTVGEGDNEEKIAVGALNETTKTFTIISRGLEYGRWASSTDNMNQHLPGERIYVSNDDAFLYEQYYSLEGDQTIEGNNTYTGTNTFTGNVIIPDYTSSDITFGANIGYVNSVASSGVADMSETIAGKVEGATRAEMSAGTETGGAGPLVLQSKYATSTGGYATTSIPVTGSNGKLHEGFMPEEIIQTGTTTLATTTISKLTVNNKSTFGDTVTIPNTTPNAGTEAISAGYATSTFGNIQQVYASSTLFFTTTQSTTTLYTIPAGVLGTTGGLRIKITGYTENAAQHDYKLYMNGTYVHTIHTESAAQAFTTDTTIYNRWATNVQDINTADTRTASPYYVNAVTNSAIDTTVDVLLQLELTGSRLNIYSIYVDLIK